MKQYAYYPGCSLESTAREYSLSCQALFNTLEVELLEIPDWSCCGSTPAHQADKELSIALPIKNLLWPQEKNLEVLAPCASCFSRLKLSNLEIEKDIELLHKINELLGGEYKGQVKVYNILEVLNQDFILEKIRAVVGRASSPDNICQARPALPELTGQRPVLPKIACYYGCLLVRPKQIEAEEMENPQVMEKICQAAGYQTIDWPDKTECCGASFSVTKPEIMLKLIYYILQMAKDSGADCLAVACPLCQSNLDLRQNEVEKRYNIKLGLPILYITQIVGLALGIKSEKLGLDKLFISPDKILSRMNING